MNYVLVLVDGDCMPVGHWITIGGSIGDCTNKSNSSSMNFSKVERVAVVKRHGC